MNQLAVWTLSRVSPCAYLAHTFMSVITVKRLHMEIADSFPAAAMPDMDKVSDPWQTSEPADGGLRHYETGSTTET